MNIIRRTKRDLTAAFSAIERESTKMAMAVNESKAKSMLSTSRNLRSIDPQITILLIQSRNLFILAPPIPAKMMSIGRSNAGSLLPSGATVVSISN